MNFKFDYEFSFKREIIVYSPWVPKLIIVSATVYRLIDPSFKIFDKTGKATWEIEGPIALTAMQAVVQTFQY